MYIHSLLLFLLLSLALSACAQANPKVQTTSSLISQPNKISTELKKENVCDTALKFIGTPYKYGGSNPSIGFDCSGLVQWVYAQHGLALPRVARDQMRQGVAIKKEELRPGDLLGFKISNRRGYHTGIYIGDGKFVHSPARGNTVREEELSSAYWGPRLISMRRLQ